MNELNARTITEALQRASQNAAKLQQYHAQMRSAVSDGSRTPPYFTPEQFRKACELQRRELLRECQRLQKMGDSYEALDKAIYNRNQAIAMEQQALEMSEDI